MAVAERALQYGDGCFTTMAFYLGELQLWPQHLARLQHNCQRLGITFLQWSKLHADLTILLEKLNRTSGVIKIIISRGTGGRGYSPQGVSEASYIISSHPLPAHYADWQQQGITLGLSPVRLARQPLLAGIKHLNRLEQVLIKQALDATTLDDVLVCDTQDNIIEASAGNVFWWHQGTWFTPCLAQSGVAGVMRDTVCQLIASTGQTVRETNQTMTTNFAAEEMFLCNALMGIVPVNVLHADELSQQWHFNRDKVNALQVALHAHLQDSLT